jgi:23S rRNA pseudouridine2605 synthase
VKTKRNKQDQFTESRHPSASRGPGNLNPLNKLDSGFHRNDEGRPPSPYSNFIKHDTRRNPDAPGTGKTPFPGKQEGKNLPQRLQRILAQSGLAPRRQAEELIREGRVRVDGQIVQQLGLKIVSSEHRIEVDGKTLAASETKTYYLFNKPKGVLSTLQDPQGRPTIKDFLTQARIKERLFPVGRLDWDAEGLMLLTNDGELAQHLQHPRFQVPKTYRIKVRGIPSETSLHLLEKGIKLPGGKIHQADQEMVKTGEDRSWLLITIREGENHQIKNMLSAIGHPVLTIKRIALGPLTLGRLAPGELRPLTQKEIQSLKELVPLEPRLKQTD